MWSRCDADDLGADQPGVGAVDAAVAGPGVGFARPTNALGPHLGFAPIRFGQMESPRLGFQLGWRRSSFLPLDVVMDSDWTPSSSHTAAAVKGKNGLSQGWKAPVNAHALAVGLAG